MRPVTRPNAPQTELPIRNNPSAQRAAGTVSFQDELNKQLQVRQQQPVTFSAHALERLRMRNIRLTQDDMTRLGSAIDRVAAKGGRESLVVYNDTAYLINVKNRTVITAVDKAHMQDHVFTKIDSAVFA
ncbi:TIGR02530 family flagellar biosynthesis protein [Tumebacillus permanentifrigoris]|nr:TIGR02530 family flagellar biosynthesis protein [Tumebacillus permanentifrigoris]